MMKLDDIKSIDTHAWEIPSTGSMRVPGLIFASRELIQRMDEKVREQVSNVASLPGIQRASMAMPDAHWGYGFPIGGVGAFDPEENGVISMGGVGFDIACGVRTLKTGLTREDIKPKIKSLVDELYRTVPAGLGSTGKIHLTLNGIDDVLIGGAEWAVEQGYGITEDLNFTEEQGKIQGAKPENVSIRAKKRQFKQVGTLGSGNHYLEIQYVDEIFDENAAKVFDLHKNDIVVSIHCGSRGLGHQIGMDYLKELDKAARKYKIPIRERELVSAPINSPEGQRYFSAVCAGINCAMANRQVIAHLTRKAFNKIIPQSNVTMLYDIAHNTCKVETHSVDGINKKLYIHRKGSTRAFGPGRPELPQEYKSIGQPVLIGGTMGTSSYILVGTKEGLTKSFGSACHGAGRRMSRRRAKRQWYGERVVKDLERKGILVRAHSMPGVAEEAPGAYKDVNRVIDAVVKAGLSKKVAKVKPLGVIKG